MSDQQSRSVCHSPSPAAELRRERILASPRFVDGSFRNTADVGPGLNPEAAPLTVREVVSGWSRRTPPGPLPALDPLTPWTRAADSGLRVTWLGHSTMLIELDGQRVLTDPVWGQRASPLRFAGPKRFQPVPVAIEALPPLDAVIISHDHYDHLCRSSVVELARAQPQLRFYTSLGVGGHLEEWGIAPARIVELDWWERVEIPRADRRGHIEIVAAPSQHFSGRGLRDRNATLWSSFVIRNDRHRVFFSGDTGLTEEYGEIASRLGPFDLVMLEVGAHHPAWGQIHLGPDNALQALGLLGGGALLPVHWGTFNLALHAWDQPAERLIELLPTLTGRSSLLMPKLGAPLEPAHIDDRLGVQPWWRELAARERSVTTAADGHEDGESGELPDLPVAPID
ncbi:MAG: MBL fold metallo-hydrolase [Myxococcales bacterium]|nr:MBL fold metallo-hydrolase [Myxococcales bacterium]